MPFVIFGVYHCKSGIVSFELHLRSLRRPIDVCGGIAVADIRWDHVSVCIAVSQ